MIPFGTMDIRNPEQIGIVVRAERKRLKVTQKDLAMTCGIGRRFIVDLEKGKASCEIGKVLRVLQTLGLTIRMERP